jgi:hypothetical protein
MYSIMVEKLFKSHFNSFFYVHILAFSCISYNTYKFKSSVEVYPIEAYLIGKGVVEVSGCHQKLPNETWSRCLWLNIQ